MDVDNPSAPTASTSAPSATAGSTNPAVPIVVPEGMRLHTENTTHLLLAENEAFLNPVQEFNRDLSIACIRTWSELREKERQAKREAGRARKRAKAAKNAETTDGATKEGKEGGAAKEEGETYKPAPQKTTILEALSATGLRSIRYAKEIPLASRVIANDLSPAAAEAIRRNVDINGPLAQERVHVNQGDACALLYNHRSSPVDVVDLDPYGTAAPFIDGAVQAIRDGGLLCVTCTDLAVLATVNYPEKCYSNYGGVSVKADYCHESALRLLLHSLATAAARYGRAIEPLLCLSIDFYVRVFVRVRYAAIEVKRLELDAPFYFTPARVAGHFHCVTPSLDEVASALLHAGYAVSRSHAAAGSLKSDAPMRALHDIFRAWVASHPVNRDKIAAGSPTLKLLDKEGSFEANFKRHPDSVSASSKVKLVRYQVNPTANWGPGTKAGGKRKRGNDDEGEQ
ncbi:N2,N2-dimethylguanosine tRNA methyltransferase-domain-containing protein [Schizophyllum fasciatum]